MRGSSMRFRGVNDSAPVMAEGEQEVTAGIAGADVNLRFQRLPKSKTPILISIHQLEELDAILHIKDKKADFKAINKYGIPLNKTEKGHLTISLKEWPKQEKKKAVPSVTADEIDIWSAEVQHIDKGILRRKQRKQIEMWEKELQGKLDQCPRNKEIHGVRDDAYGHGWLTLSALSVAGIDSTFCNQCYIGISSTGDAGGENS